MMLELGRLASEKIRSKWVFWIRASAWSVVSARATEYLFLRSHSARVLRMIISGSRTIIL